MELKSIRRRYWANRIWLFALNSQSHWLIFANFGNLRHFFLKFDQVKKLFREIMYHENSPEFLESCDIFWLNKYFEFNKIWHFFKLQFWKPILKHVTSKFIV